jgi:endoglucanase
VSSGGKPGGSIASGGTTATGGSKPMGGTTSAGGTTGGTTASGGSITVGDGGLLAAESASFHCFNWADAGDNFQKGALVLTGLAATDSYDTVLASSNAILSGFKSALGANSFRIPINETTVNTATTWAAYKGIFDAAISQNVKVIVAYWLPPGSNHVADTTTWNTMWKTVVDAYVSSDLVYFDVFNEPSGYSATAFITLVQQWMTANPSVPANRVLVAGTTTDIDVNQQGAALPNCLLSLHIYDSVGNTVAAAQAAVKTHAGPYYNRTIVTEYVGQSLFMQGITTQMKAYGMGSCYWAGLEGTGGVAKLSGTKPNYTVTVNNAANLTLIQSGWTQ